jgi:tetratricopeptide (TPR) repeat protein
MMRDVRAAAVLIAAVLAACGSAPREPTAPTSKPSPPSRPAAAPARDAGDRAPDGGLPEDAQAQLADYDARLRELSPGDDEWPMVMFQRGKLLWQHRQFDAAIAAFEIIVTDHLDSEHAEHAVDLLLDSLNRAQRYDAMARWAKALLEQRAFLAGREQLATSLRRIVRQAERKRAELAEKAGDFTGCAAIYLAIFNADPQAERSDELLYNAAVCAEQALDIGTSITLSNTIVTRFPKSQLARKALVRAAVLYARIGDYRAAAYEYERYAKRYPGERDAADALATAVYYRRALGDDDRAIAGVELYVKLFRKKRGGEAAAALFSLVPIYRERGDTDLERHLRRYLKDIGARGGDDRVIVAQVELGRLAWKRSCRRATRGLCNTKRNGKRATEASKWLTKAIASGGRVLANDRDLDASRTEQTRDAIGAARFLLADAELEAALRNPKQPIDDVERAYARVVETKAGRWSIAAQARLGKLYEARGDSERAADQYVACLDTASDVSLDTEHSRWCAKQVAELRPAAAPPHERLPRGDSIGEILSRPALQE